MKITADTNVLLRIVLGDHVAQGATALAVVESASQVAISVHSLCELAWVLASKVGMPRQEIAATIGALVAAKNIMVNRPAVDAGLNMLLAGGDFADGVIAYEGRWLGGDTFVSFDKKAVKLLDQAGFDTRLLD